MNNPLKGKSRTVQILVVIGILLLVVSAGAAIYKLLASNAVTVQVNDTTTYIPVSLTTSASTIIVGSPITLTATISDPNGNGHTVHFMEGATEVGSATISSLQASITITPTVGSHTYSTAAEP
jgi:hypothetical protein